MRKQRDRDRRAQRREKSGTIYPPRRKKIAHRSQSELACNARAAARHIQSSARNVFSLIYTCLVGFFFPICDLTLSSSYHKYRFAFSLLSFNMRTHNWRHAFTRNVQLSLNDTWLFIILVQIIDSTSAEGREKNAHSHTHTS